MRKIVVIDNYDSFTFNLVHYIEELTNSPITVFRNDCIDIDSLSEFDTFILSPGPGLPDEAGILKDLIKTYAHHKKILGVCLGMQAICEVFGGTLTNLNTVYHGVATPINIKHNHDLLYKNLPDTITVGRYHSWVVNPNTLPKNLQVTATDEKQHIMSVTHTHYPIYGVQFHPESILSPEGKQIIANFLDIN